MVVDLENRSLPKFASSGRTGPSSLRFRFLLSFLSLRPIVRTGLLRRLYEFGWAHCRSGCVSRCRLSLRLRLGNPFVHTLLVVVDIVVVLSMSWVWGWMGEKTELNRSQNIFLR